MVKVPMAKQDVLSSVVVFLVALPLCMGIAIASGVPPAAGLITGIIGGIVVGLISGCPLQVSGPAAGLAVIVYQIIQKGGIESLGPIVLLGGLIQISAALLRGGQIFRAISPSVIYGMLAGIGILIFGAQFHVMVDDSPREGGLQNLISIPEAIYKGLFPMDGSSHHLAAYIGSGTILVLLLWTRFAPRKLKVVPAALVAVVAATMAAALFALPIRYVELPDDFITAITPMQLDRLIGLLSLELLGSALALAFVASAETLLSATAVDQMHDGPKTNYDRELLSQGVGNSLCGFVGSLPMTGVIVRSATNVAAGAKTRWSSVLHGIWMLVLVVVFPGVLRLVPTASLAAILVYTGYKLVNPKDIRKLLRYGGFPMFIYAATVIVIVSKDLLTGILTGIVLSLIKIMWARTHLFIRSETHGGWVDLQLSGAATFLRLPKLINALDTLPHDRELRIHTRELQYVDHACVDALSEWERKRRDAGQSVVIEWGHIMRIYRESTPLPPKDDDEEQQSQPASRTRG